MVKCVSCGKEVDNVCRDGYCRKCHVSLSFEDCMNGTWTANMVLRDGMPRDIVKRTYPNAKI